MSNQRSAAVGRLVVQVTRMVRQSGRIAGFDPLAWVEQWIEQPVPALGNRKPVELLDTAEGEQLVADVLARMQSCAYS